ncbi:lipopolysaccharide biosynthesis protein [Altericroceibacterium xinjiangense]|uniref:lipopolysaccharide biosynthesis protein n=1 Tax=Altericroceibacterium xinjiangense TaxID=762261 RepID=UPI000F7EDDD3|nr:lipopolysaccharide biosynthesis protein [Altericroceibacterium xinjiangense]
MVEAINNEAPAVKRKASQSLKRDAAWTAADTLVSAGSAFLFRLVVARFIVPAEFGVFALALTTVAIVQVFNEFGMAATIIQRAEDRFTPELVDTAYSASTLISTALFVINLIFIAPLAAWFYSSERVGIISAVVGVSFLFTPTASIARALLFRARDYRTVTVARIVSTLLSLVAAVVVLVFYRNVWALVVQAVSAQVILAFAMWRLSEWRPRFRLDRRTFREMIGYSGFVFANDLFVSISRNLDVITLGRILSQSQVGIYSLAFYVTDIVRMNVMSILNRVMFTHYSSIQNDHDAVRFYYIRTASWNALLIFPVMVAIILAGPVLTPVFLGADWRAMGIPLQLLAVSVMIHAAGGATSTVYKALGRPGLDFTLNVLTSVIILLPALIFGVLWAGMAGAAAAVAGAKAISAIIRQILLDRMIGSTLAGVLKSTAGALLMQVPLVIAWGVVMRFVPLETSVRAIVALAAGFGAYGAAMLLAYTTKNSAWPAFDDRRAQGKAAGRP